jgi:hypothetical protein
MSVHCHKNRFIYMLLESVIPFNGIVLVINLRSFQCDDDATITAGNGREYSIRYYNMRFCRFCLIR